MQYFDPAETAWSVTRYDKGVAAGEADSQLWRFYADGRFDAGTEGRGIYGAIRGSDNAHECKVTAPGADTLSTAAEDGVDHFFSAFISEKNLVATKRNALYLFGSRADAVIDLMIVIDGESFSNADGQRVGYMFASVDRVVAGNGSAQLQLCANPGDILRVSAISTDNQAMNAVFVYDVKHRDGAVVLGTAVLRTHANPIIAANQRSAQESHSPPDIEFAAQTFYNCLIPVCGQGTEEFDVVFVLYGPPSGGERNCLGEFTFPASITICVEEEAGT